MELLRFTNLDLDLIKNLPSDMRDDLIKLDDVIPDDIMSTIYSHDPTYKKERGNFLEFRPGILQQMYEFRRNRKKLTEKDHFYNVDTDLNVSFIKSYPQFKQLISSVSFLDENRNIVKVVPIDQYLAEN